MLKRRNWLISLIVVAVALGMLWITCPICFQNNDDKVLMYLTAGYTTGTPEAGTVFGSFYYYGIIALFYRIYSGIAWYTIFELAMVAGSLWIICNSFIRATERLHKAIGIVVFILMFLFCFMHFSTALQYTATAGLVAGAAAASLLASLDSDRLTDNHFIISVVMLVLAYGIRKQFGLVGLAAVLIILFFQFFSENRKTVVKKGLVILAAMIVAYGSNAIYERATGIAEFNDYYAQAGTWIDYPHLPYDEDTEGVYESVGWDETLYNAAGSWFFMDEHLTTDNFNTIVDAYDGPEYTAKDYLRTAYNLVVPSKIVNIQVAIWIILLVIINIYLIERYIAIREKSLIRNLLTIDALFGMFALVSIYFLIQARFPMRAYEALVFIFFVPSMIMIVQDLINSETRLIVIALGIMLGVMLAGYVIKPDTNMVSYTYTVAHDIYRDADIALSDSFEEYAITHPDNMYIYDLELALPADPFTVYTDGVPKNVVFWGGWVYNTPMYWKQIQANGLDTLYIDDFFSGRVYFCGKEISNTLCDYIKVRYQDAAVETADEFNGIVVYDFYRN